MMESLRLAGLGQHEEAVRLVDELISDAIKEGDETAAFIFIRHAAIVSMTGTLDYALMKRDFELYLTHYPENPRALYELADLAVKDGQADLARQYATRCYRSLLQSTDEKAKKDLFELVLERWPAVSEQAESEGK